MANSHREQSCRLRKESRIRAVTPDDRIPCRLHCSNRLLRRPCPRLRRKPSLFLPNRSRSSLPIVPRLRVLLLQSPTRTLVHLQPLPRRQQLPRPQARLQKAARYPLTNMTARTSTSINSRMVSRRPIVRPRRAKIRTRDADLRPVDNSKKQVVDDPRSLVRSTALLLLRDLCPSPSRSQRPSKWPKGAQMCHPSHRRRLGLWLSRPRQSRHLCLRALQ